MDLSRLMFETEVRVPRPDKQHTSEWIQCDCGWATEKDYAIHIIPLHEQRSFPPDLSEVYRIVAKHLDPAVPKNLTVEIHPPDITWEVPSISFLVLGAKKDWGFRRRDIEAALAPMCQELDAYVESYAAWRRRHGLSPKRTHQLGRAT